MRIRTARDGQQFDSSAFHSALAKENDKDLKWGDWSMILLALVCACVFLWGMEGENDKLEKVKIKSQFNFGYLTYDTTSIKLILFLYKLFNSCLFCTSC